MIRRVKLSINVGAIILAIAFIFLFILARAEAYSAKHKYCDISPGSTFCQMYPNGEGE